MDFPHEVIQQHCQSSMKQPQHGPDDKLSVSTHQGREAVLPLNVVIPLKLLEVACKQTGAASQRSPHTLLCCSVTYARVAYGLWTTSL